VSIIFIVFYLCGGEKRKRKKKHRISTKRKRGRKPQELSRAYFGNENLAGPQNERGISVISPSGLNFAPNQENPVLMRSQPVSYERHTGVVQNPGGRQDVCVLSSPGRGSMDSINSVQSSTLSFESTRSTGN